MGNNQAGMAIVKVVESLHEMFPECDPDTILDIACAPYVEMDVEFDGQEYGSKTAGYGTDILRDMLIARFNPCYNPELDEDGDVFYETILKPFSRKYMFQ